MNIFIGNLASTVSSEDLRRLFAGYGTVIRALVMRDTATGRPLGYGHVYLVPDDAARQAVVKLNGSNIAGQPIDVRECNPRTRHDRRKSILPWHGIERRQAQRRFSNVSEITHRVAAENLPLTPEKDKSASGGG
jgi:RNA recognition motif-containing protein